MATLVVYQESNLATPAKLLTHFEDIHSELAELSIGLDQVTMTGLPQQLECIEQVPRELVEALLRIQGEGACAHVDLLCLPALPAYALPQPEEGDAEHSHVQSGTRCFLRGGGVVCLHLAGQVLALGCGPGDALTIPSGTAHWFRPRPGEGARILRAARAGDGLVQYPTGSDIAATLLLPDL
jgi:1,2-dihydroxy-3-keto-5-methylthiopentene dioxygenase